MAAPPVADIDAVVVETMVIGGEETTTLGLG